MMFDAPPGNDQSTFATGMLAGLGLREFSQVMGLSRKRQQKPQAMPSAATMLEGNMGDADRMMLLAKLQRFMGPGAAGSPGLPGPVPPAGLSGPGPGPLPPPGMPPPGMPPPGMLRPPGGPLPGALPPPGAMGPPPGMLPPGVMPPRPMPPPGMAPAGAPTGGPPMGGPPPGGNNAMANPLAMQLLAQLMASAQGVV